MKKMFATTAFVVCLATSALGQAAGHSTLGNTGGWGYAALNTVTFGLYGNYKAAGNFKHGEWKSGAYFYSRPKARPASMVKTTSKFHRAVIRNNMSPGGRLRNDKAMSSFLYGGNKGLEGFGGSGGYYGDSCSGNSASC